MTTRAVAILFTAIWMAASAVAQDADEYWAVGSFRTLSSAQVESQRIERVAGETVHVARFELSSGTLYRLVVPKSSRPQSQKQALASAGIDAWTVSAGRSGLDFVARSAVPGEETWYQLVVGSFQGEMVAEDYAADMRSRGAETAQLIAGTSNGSDIYRVVMGPYDYKDDSAKAQAAALGVNDSWWMALKVTANRQASREAPPAAPARATATTPAMPVAADEKEAMPAVARAESPRTNTAAPKPSMTVSGDRAPRAPQPNESYFDYCIKKATPKERELYCEDQKFSTVAIAEKQVKAGARGGAYVNFCATQATPEQRKEHCQDSTFANRVTPD